MKIVVECLALGLNSASEMPISVAIVDDHQLAINGIKSMLEGYSNIIVSNTYQSGDALMEGLAKEIPDVLLLDIIMAGQSGKILAPIIKEKYPSVKIVALTSLDAPAMVSSMMRRGCIGYLLKDTDSETLVKAIESAYAGQEFIDESIKKKILSSVLAPLTDKEQIVPEITKREMQILRLIVEEYTTKEISEKLFISFRTVENHRYSLLQKLDVKSSIGLVKVALSMGLLE